MGFPVAEKFTLLKPTLSLSDPLCIYLWTHWNKLSQSVGKWTPWKSGSVHYLAMAFPQIQQLKKVVGTYQQQLAQR
jgi:hypothetical protein